MTRPLTEDEQRQVLKMEPMIQHCAAYVARAVPGLPFEDLLQVGRMDAMGAVTAYDPTRGEFEKYAHPGVLGAMIDAATRHAGWSEPQRALFKRMIDGAVSALPREAASGASPGERLREEAEAYDAIGAGIALGASAGEPLDPEHAAMQAEIRRALAEARGRLPQRQRRIVELHWLDGVALDAIGPIVGLGRTMVKEQHRKALAKLRVLMEARA